MSQKRCSKCSNTINQLSSVTLHLGLHSAVAMLKGTSKNAFFFFHSVKTWLLLFSVVAGCLKMRGTALHFLKHPLLRFSPLINGGYHGGKGQWFLSNVKLWGSSSFTRLGALRLAWLWLALWDPDSHKYVSP